MVISAKPILSALKNWEWSIFFKQVNDVETILKEIS